MARRRPSHRVKQRVLRPWRPRRAPAARPSAGRIGAAALLRRATVPWNQPLASAGQRNSSGPSAGESGRGPRRRRSARSRNPGVATGGGGAGAPAGPGAAEMNQMIGTVNRRSGGAAPTRGVAARGRGVVLRHLLRTVRRPIQPQSRVVRLRVTRPSHWQVPRDAAHRPAIEQWLHLMLALLPRVRHLGRRRPNPLEEGLVAASVDRTVGLPGYRASSAAARRSQGSGRRSRRRGRPTRPTAGTAYQRRRREQLLGPQQHAVAAMRPLLGTPRGACAPLPPQRRTFRKP